MTDFAPTGSDNDLETILHGEYACTRSWEAWQVGTMTQDDFTPMLETEIVGDLLNWRDAAVKAALDAAIREMHANPMWATAPDLATAQAAAAWFEHIIRATVPGALTAS